MYPFESYTKANSINDAIRLLSSDYQAKLIAGGTEILIRLHKETKGHSLIVDIHSVEALQKIVLTNEGHLNIGSGTTFSQIINSEIIQEHLPVLAEAVATVGGP